MVVGGQLDNGEALDDVWRLDVDDVLWTKVGIVCPIAYPGAPYANSHTHVSSFMPLQLKLYIPIKPRYGHSAVMFDLGPQLRMVVLFGGSMKEGYYLKHTSETTLLWLGK